MALLDGCILLGVLAELALGAVHAVFGVLAVLALGNVHASSNILAKPYLFIFALLVVAWRNVGIVASCKQQCIIFDCFVGVVHVCLLLLLLLAI